MQLIFMKSSICSWLADFAVQVLLPLVLGQNWCVQADCFDQYCYCTCAVIQLYIAPAIGGKRILWRPGQLPIRG